MGSAAALIGGALVFHFTKGKVISTNQVLKEIDALGQPEKEEDGLLSFEYYQKVFIIISKYAKIRFANEKKVLLEERRRLLLEGKNAEYVEIVKEIV